MNKSELINAIADQTDLPVSKAAEFLKAFQAVVTSELKAQRQVALVGFGTFLATERAARTGRNPTSGEPINIDKAWVPKFKPGAVLRRSVN
jgi:DNA-binding protein HU-beta